MMLRRPTTKMPTPLLPPPMSLPLITILLFPLLLLLVGCFQTAGAAPPDAWQGSEDGGSDGAPVHSLRRRSTSDSDECRSVSDAFAGYSFEEDPEIPTSRITGQNLEICNETTSGTCCTKSLEEKLVSLAVFQTQDVIANFSFNLKSQLTSDAKSFRDHFNELLSLSENNTRYVLTSTLRIPVVNANASVEKLFSDFAAYIRIQDQVNVKQSVDQFFDAIFPLVFTFSLDNPNAVTDEYQICLVNNRRELRPAPFGDVARRLVQDVAKSLEVPRALLDAFDLMAEAINITSHLGSEQYCSNAVARLLFCSRCEGLAEVPPCRNLCLNVMRGCMAHIAEVNSHWNLLVAAVDKVISSLRGAHDFQDVLNSFHSKVYESVMHYLDNSDMYRNKVINKCGPPLGEVTAEMTATPNGEADTSRLATTEPGKPLLEEFPTKVHKKFPFSAVLRNIVSSKGFFNRLPDEICEFEKFASAAVNGTCWNGTAVSRYSRSVPIAALKVQVSDNPELHIPDALVPEVRRLIERLNQMTKVLHKRVIPQQPSFLSWPRSFDDDFVSGSGSGWFGSNFTFPDDDDDEDYDRSGSGSGNITDGSTPSETTEFEVTVKRVDTTDFVFDPNSTLPSSSQPSPYRTRTPEAITLSSSITSATTSTAVTDVAKPRDPTSQSTVTCRGSFLPILVITILRISCA